MHRKLRFQKGDILVIGAALLLAVLLFLLFLPGKDEPGAVVQVYQNGELLHTLPLNEPREITVSGRYENIVTVHEGKVAVTASGCPGEDCVACGWISTPGRSIVCLPNGLELRIVAQRQDVDFVVG